MIARATIAALCAGLLIALSWAALSLPGDPPGLTGPSLARLPESGVKNPVTAVLLNYRGYDTLLEVAVLLVAIVGVWSLGRGPVRTAPAGDRPLLRALVRFVLPILVVVAGYLLWIGSSAPGGAFQGGALLGGAFVLALLGGFAEPLLSRERLLRGGLVLGLLVFAASAAGTMALTGGLLRYPPGTGGVWILAIESAALVSIGLTLGLLYVCGRPRVDGTPPVGKGDPDRP